MRILIIEDEKEIADGLQTILTREGYQADVVYNGSTGLDYLLSNIYDLALLDIMLPSINGIQILEETRNQGIKIPIILLTAKSQSEDKIAGLDHGADDYITKPFHIGELMARIRARTRGNNHTKECRLILGTTWLDQTTQKMGNGSDSIKLGNKEFQLMECLMINHGHIMPKDLLITKIWGFEDKTEYNNLEVYISFLRKKLRFLKADIQIKTTKGVGYSLER